MLELVTQDQPADVELIPLFSIDGKEYGIPKHVDMSIVLRTLKNMRNSSEMEALGQMLEELLGAEAYDALSNYKGLTGEHLKQLMDTVTEHAMGQLEDATKNS